MNCSRPAIYRCGSNRMTCPGSPGGAGRGSLRSVASPLRCCGSQYGLLQPTPSSDCRHRNTDCTCPTTTTTSPGILGPTSVETPLISCEFAMKLKMNEIVSASERWPLLVKINEILTKNTDYERLSPKVLVDVMSLILDNSQKIIDYEGVKDAFLCDVVFDQCSKDSLLKIVTKEIPKVIFPDGKDVSLIDVRPNAKGPDDGMYEKYAILRKMIPRGVSILSLMVNGKKTMDTSIYGTRKFAGLTIEDDDDHQSCDSKQYFLHSLDTAIKVVTMEKVNGEAAHFSGRFIDGHFYFIAGSKNVHLVFREEGHIDQYPEDRYRIAREIALALFRKWLTLSEQTREFLQNFLHLTRVTVVCEIMIPDHQHVVYFDDLKENKLVILSVTQPPPSGLTGDPNESFTALSVHQTLLLFSALGFDVPESRVLDIQDLPTHQTSVRERTRSEGVVYYFIDQQGCTIGLMKLKTIWYIHLRALRQQASYRHKISEKFRKTTALEESTKRSRSRLKELQSWLHTSDAQLDAWGIVSDEWFVWLEKNVSFDGFPTPSDVRNNFPVVWKPFIASLENSSEDLVAAVTLLNLKG